jgi:hypothetical protein
MIGLGRARGDYLAREYNLFDPAVAFALGLLLIPIGAETRGNLLPTQRVLRNSEAA